MSDFLEFNCSACGHGNLLESAEMPPEGMARTCQSCGASVYIRREDTADGGGYGELTVETLPPSPDAEEGEGIGLHLRLSTGTVQTLSADAVAHGIQDGRVRPWDLVSDNGVDFYQASQHEELQHYFAPGDMTPVISRTCINHREQPPAGTCRKCGRSYCADCFSTILQMQPRQCPACNGSVQDPDPRLTEKPPWERWRDVARYPIVDDAWRITAFIGGFFFVGALSLFLIPAYLVSLLLLTHVAKSSAEGVKKLTLDNLKPEPLLKQFVPIAVFAAVMGGIALAIDLFVSPTGRAFLQLPITLIAFAYFPMAIGLLLLGKSTATAFEPKTVIQAIKTLREDYLLIALFLIAISVVVLALQILFSFIPYLGRLLAAAALAYGSVGQAHALGSLLYLHRERVLSSV